MCRLLSVDRLFKLATFNGRKKQLHTKCKIEFMRMTVA